MVLWYYYCTTFYAFLLQIYARRRRVQQRTIMYKLRLYRLYFPPFPVLASFQRLWRGRRSAYNLWYHYGSYNTYIIVQCDSPFTWHAQSNCFLQIVIFVIFKYIKWQYFQILGFFLSCKKFRHVSLWWFSNENHLFWLVTC